MLSNAYFLAKFRFDVAENEPSKNLQKKLLVLPLVASVPPSEELPRRRRRPQRLPGAPGAGPQREPVVRLVERFDIEPLSDFSAK